MIQFLLWTTPRPETVPGPGNVAHAFESLLAPLFETPPTVSTLSFGQVHLAFFTLPIDGWRPSFVQEDDRTIALGIAYPLNGHAVLAANGFPVSDPITCLPRLARAIQVDPGIILKDLVPPMLLFWADKATGNAYLVNDGLGHAQLYETDFGDGVALSNRLSAFSALGIPLEPMASEWAAKVTIGWFPLHLSGFKGISFAKASTLYRWDRSGFRKHRIPVLEKWVLRERRSEADCLEQARWGLINYINATWPLFSDASGGLTGGFDSRAIFATYRHLGLPMRPRVKGPPNNHDVVISKELARIAGLDLTVKNRAEQPPANPEDVRRSIRAALVWQMGNIDYIKHIAFLPAGARLSGGSVNLMGHDGFIGRGFFQHMLRTREIPFGLYTARMMEWFMKLAPPFLDDVIKEHVADLVREMCHQSERYGVVDEKLLDFVYMFERSRRWSSGSQHSQASLVLAPFLNPEYIRAVFSYYGEGMVDSVFHRHIIRVNAPDWADVVYERELKQAEKKRKKKLKRAAPKGGDWRRSNNSGYFNRLEFWKQVGAGLIEESMRQGRLWRAVYDPGKIPVGGFALGDALTMLYEMERITTGHL